MLIRGGGDLASGAAYRLIRCGIRCMVTELPKPLSVRRLVSYSSAVYMGSIVVDGVKAHLADSVDQAIKIMDQLQIPVLVDPELSLLKRIIPTVIIDGRMKKMVDKSRLDMNIPIIGLGPGFTAGRDCRAVIETNRGPRLGRVILEGKTEDDTGIPEQVKQHSVDRVLRSPGDGILTAKVQITDKVTRGQVLAEVNNDEITAKFDGVIRGLLLDGSLVKKGMKIGDLDPRQIPELATRISEKALAIGGGVLEAILSDAVLRSILMCTRNETA